jgi:hypothetical protein
VTEQLLILRSVIALGQKAQRIGTAYLGSRQVVFAVMPGRLAAYDISLPSQPRLFGAWTVQGIKGALPWRGGLLAFGTAGFTTIAADGTLKSIASAHPILDAVAGVDGIVAAGPSTIDSYSSLLTLQTSTPANAARLARLGSTVLAAGAGKLSFVDISNPAQLRASGNQLQLDAVDFVPLPDSGERNLVAVSPQGSSVVTVPVDGAAKVIARFPGVPWFLNSARLPGLLVRLADDLSTIRLSSLGAVKTI